MTYCLSKQISTCGVPQDSFVSPLLFIVYINDLPHASKLTQPLFLADDTSIFYSQSDPNYLESVLNDELYNLDIWMKCNKLSVNSKKTSYNIFKSRQKKLDKSFSLSFWKSDIETITTNLNITFYLQKRVVRAITNSDYREHTAPIFAKLVVNCYRPHNCRTNHKWFTILYQGPKIWNSLPVSITGLTSFLKLIF